MARAASLLLCSTLSLWLLASAASAQTDASDARARAHFSAASAYYEEGDYAQALVEFRAAYDLSHRAGLLYNVYLCEERLGHLDAAVEALEAYLGSDVEVPNRATLEARLGHLHERQAAGASTVEVAEVDVATAPAPPAAEGPSTLAIAGFSVAAVGLVGFAVFGPWTLAEDGRLSSTCSPTCAPGDVELLRATSIASDVSLGVALAGAVVGVIGLVLPSGGSSDTARLLIGPGSVGVAGTF